MENLLTHYCPFCKNELQFTRYALVCDCGYKFPNQINDRGITEEELIHFEKNGFTPILKCITKQGKPCKVRLMLNKRERKVDYQFEGRK